MLAFATRISSDLAQKCGRVEEKATELSTASCKRKGSSVSRPTCEGPLGEELLRGVGSITSAERLGESGITQEEALVRSPLRVRRPRLRPPQDGSPQVVFLQIRRDAGLSSGSATADGSSSCAQRATDSATGFSYSGGNRRQSPHHRPRQHPPALRGPRVRAVRPGKQ